jgi:hypothetical protein
VTLQQFRLAPWKTSHEVYRASSLSISPAPEYASSEVLIASLFRFAGYGSVSEGSVPTAGRDFDRRLQKSRDRGRQPARATIDADALSAVLHGILESPKLPNQSTKRFLQVSPIVPAVAQYSGSARLSANSWPAGSLIRRMIWLGAESGAAAAHLWQRLFDAMSVSEKDDVFARWLDEEIVAWSDGASGWSFVPPDASDVAALSPTDLTLVQMPARQLVKDLDATIRAKEAMTRRQWMTMLEAILRLGAAAHVIWLCDVQARIWEVARLSILRGGPRTVAEVRDQIFPSTLNYMGYGDRALPDIKDRVSRYLQARLSLNALLWHLEEAGLSFKGDLSSSEGVAALCEHLRNHLDRMNASGLLSLIADTNEKEARALLCKKGIGSNIMEFARHTLGQRQSAVAILRGYDQGYILKKRGESSSSPWIVSLGPVSVLALVHCALSGMAGPRSIHRLSQHLAGYGIIIDRHEIAKSDLGLQLRMLGLVLDSPDAESGMLLLPPFPLNNAAREAGA